MRNNKNPQWVCIILIFIWNNVFIVSTLAYRLTCMHSQNLYCWLLLIYTRILTDKKKINVLIALTLILYPTQLLNSHIKSTISRICIEKIKSGQIFYIKGGKRRILKKFQALLFTLWVLVSLSLTLYVLCSVWSKFWSELNNPLNSKFNCRWLATVQTSHTSLFQETCRIKSRIFIFYLPIINKYIWTKVNAELDASAPLCIKMTKSLGLRTVRISIF